MKKEIIFASYNSKKNEEIQRIAPQDVEIISLKDLPEAEGIPQAEETGNSFVENATIKAKYWAKKLNRAVIAEDSGLMIDALNGYPGVYTKRCFKELCPEASVNEDDPSTMYPILLDMMQKSRNTETTATWVSAVVYANGSRVIKAQECLNGNMGKRKGDRVFGFDQYFTPVGSTKALAELKPEKKDEISPRRRAFSQILKQISFLGY